jgi:hypothetical protein
MDNRNIPEKKRGDYLKADEVNILNNVMSVLRNTAISSGIVTPSGVSVREKPDIAMLKWGKVAELFGASETNMIKLWEHDIETGETSSSDYIYAYVIYPTTVDGTCDLAVDDIVPFFEYYDGIEDDYRGCVFAITSGDGGTVTKWLKVTSVGSTSLTCVDSEENEYTVDCTIKGGSAIDLSNSIPFIEVDDYVPVLYCPVREAYYCTVIFQTAKGILA